MSTFGSGIVIDAICLLCRVVFDRINEILMLEDQKKNKEFLDLDGRIELNNCDFGWDIKK